MTDPSYYGQIVTQTFPLIGNYGITPDFESKKPWVSAYIVREKCDEPSNFRCEEKLDKYLKDREVFIPAPVEISIEEDEGELVARIRFDPNGEVTYCEVYLSEDTENSALRNWTRCELKREEGEDEQIFRLNAYKKSTRVFAFAKAKGALSFYEEGIYWQESGRAETDRFFLKWSELVRVKLETVEGKHYLAAECAYGSYHIPEVAGAYDYLKEFRPELCEA